MPAAHVFAVFVGDPLLHDLGFLCEEKILEISASTVIACALPLQQHQRVIKAGPRQSRGQLKGVRVASLGPNFEIKISMGKTKPGTIPTVALANMMKQSSKG